MAIFNSYVKLPEGNHFFEHQWRSNFWVRMRIPRLADSLFTQDHRVVEGVSESFEPLAGWKSKKNPRWAMVGKMMINYEIRGTRDTLFSDKFTLELNRGRVGFQITTNSAHVCVISLRSTSDNVPTQCDAHWAMTLSSFFGVIFLLGKILSIDPIIRFHTHLLFRNWQYPGGYRWDSNHEWAISS